MSDLEIIQHGAHRIELEYAHGYWGASVWLGDKEVDPSGLMVQDRQAALEDAQVAIEDYEEKRRCLMKTQNGPDSRMIASLG